MSATATSGGSTVRAVYRPPKQLEAELKSIVDEATINIRRNREIIKDAQGHMFYGLTTDFAFQELPARQGTLLTKDDHLRSVTTVTLSKCKAIFQIMKRHDKNLLLYIADLYYTAKGNYVKNFYGYRPSIQQLLAMYIYMACRLAQNLGCEMIEIKVDDYAYIRVNKDTGEIVKDKEDGDKEEDSDEEEDSDKEDDESIAKISISAIRIAQGKKAFYVDHIEKLIGEELRKPPDYDNMNEALSALQLADSFDFTEDLIEKMEMIPGRQNTATYTCTLKKSKYDDYIEKCKQKCQLQSHQVQVDSKWRTPENMYLELETLPPGAPIKQPNFTPKKNEVSQLAGAAEEPLTTEKEEELSAVEAAAAAAPASPTTQAGRPKGTPPPLTKPVNTVNPKVVTLLRPLRF